jgi:hypothetical protein
MPSLGACENLSHAKHRFITGTAFAVRFPCPTSRESMMAGDNSYKPGEIVKVSGIYSVVHEDGKGTFEVTCVEGEHFPPTRSGKGAHYELKYGATHSHKHGELKGSEARS